METTPKKQLPENAKLVYQGELFKVYQWEQILYDGTTKMFEMVERPDGVNIIAIVDGKIILLDQEQPHYTKSFLTLPGGRVEVGETMIEAAKRELLEETGYTSETMLLWRSFERDGKVISEYAIYLAPNCYKVHDGEPDNGEKIRMRFIDFDELLMLSEDPNLREGGYFRELMYHLRLHQDERDELKKLLGL